MAHIKDQSHYHYFWNCSYVYNQGHTYGITVYLCPDDRGLDRYVGAVIGVSMSILAKTPLLKWIGGMLTIANEAYFDLNDGSYRFSMSDYRSLCGYVLWNTSPGVNNYMWYYCAGTANYQYAYAVWLDRYFYVRVDY